MPPSITTCRPVLLARDMLKARSVETANASPKPKILIAEDDRVAAHLYGSWLTKGGFEVKVAATGREAIEQLSLWGPDAALVDVMLPEMAGIEVMKVIRASTPHVPVIMYTNGFVSALVDQCVACGATHVLDKQHLTSMELISGFNELLRSRRAELS
jgi:CheY-like chemotaxis protein